MGSQQEYIKLLRDNAVLLQQEYGVISMRLFGSVARGMHGAGSDVDVCVDMPPKLLLAIRLKNHLEALLQTSVDVVRLRPDMNSSLRQEIDRDAIRIF